MVAVYRPDADRIPPLHAWERIVIVSHGNRTIVEICNSMDVHKTVDRLEKEFHNAEHNHSNGAVSC